MATGEDWERLGEQLIARRVALGYLTRAGFVAAKELPHSRTVSDLENAKRDNYERATLAHIEQCYEWTTGSIRRVLAGGEPTPIEDVLGINVVSELPEQSGLRAELHAVVDDLPESALRNALRSLVAMLRDEG